MTEDTIRSLAQLHLDLARALHGLRLDRDYSEQLLAERAGLSVDEIRMIEEGDTSSLTDIARLCNALDARLTIDSDFTVTLSSRAPVELRRAALG